MPVVSEFTTLLYEQLEGFGNVTIRRMFGGQGVFRDGLMFGLVAEDVLYLKTDGGNRDDYEQRGLHAFRYTRQGKERIIAYYQAPEEVLEDRIAMHEWAGKAYAAALRAVVKKTDT